MCIFRYLNVYKGRKNRKGALKKLQHDLSTQLQKNVLHFWTRDAH